MSKDGAASSAWVFTLSGVAVRAIGHFYGKVVVKAGSRLPDGPCVVIFNHSSVMDVAAMAHVVRRPVAFWAKAELRKKLLVGAWFRACGAVFVQRGGHDEEAFARGLEQLRRGLAFCLAPEGTRHHRDGDRKAHTGFVRLALLAGVPVVPIAISGARNALPPGHYLPRPWRRPLVRVEVGRPFTLAGMPVDEAHREDLALLADEAMGRVYSMKTALDEGRGL